METILFVDDSKNIRQYCKGELEDDGYRVLLAGNGQEAIDLLRREPADVVVVDVRMPRMDGLELIGRIKALHRDLPVIFYTAHHKDYVRDQRDWPSFVCVEKSEDMGELKLAIASALGQGSRVSARPAASERSSSTHARPT